MRQVSLRPAALLANVCTGRGTSLLELLRVLGAIHGRAPAISFGPSRPGDIRQSVGDPARGAALLGRTAVSLEDGLAALAEQRSIAA
jgi:UDP-glucose 4-epimerase